MEGLGKDLAHDGLKPLAVRIRVIEPSMQLRERVDAKDGVVDSIEGGFVCDALAGLLQRRRDNLKIVRHPMLHLTKQISVDTCGGFEPLERLREGLCQGYQNAA
jgi:hypothetical protein